MGRKEASSELKKEAITAYQKWFMTCAIGKKQNNSENKSYTLVSYFYFTSPSNP